MPDDVRDRWARVNVDGGEALGVAVLCVEVAMERVLKVEIVILKPITDVLKEVFGPVNGEVQRAWLK